MRLTALHPDPARGPGEHPTDVEVDAGTPVAALRPALARLTGYRRWTDPGARAWVADVALDDHHLVGQPPAVEGCVLRAAAGPRPVADEAARSRWHVAVVAGPDSGGIVALPDRGAAVRIGDFPNASLEVRDPALGAVEVHRRGDRVLARTGSRRLRARWRPARPLVVGQTTLVLRRAPGGPDHVEVAPTPLGRPTTWLPAVLGSVLLAAALQQPLLLLAGLATPLVAGTTWVAARRRRRAGAAGGTLLDPAALVAATARARTAPLAPAAAEQPWDPGGSLAVVGPRDLALAVARGVVIGELGTHARGATAVRTRHPEDWAWCRWVAADLPAAAVVVADDPPDPTWLARWRSATPATTRLLVVAGSAAAVPAWCLAWLEVGPRLVVLHESDGGARAVPRHAVTEDRALAQVRAATAARAAAGADDPGSALPVRAALGALDGIPAPDAVADAWRHPRTGLVATLGLGGGGRTVTVDLVADGPHALVAGTTGAGKSELLTALVLSLAVTHPPDRLAILLVDFKGGTGLGPLAGLPHVLEHVTDLDATHARRVLAALRAELRRRESVLAEAGVRDLRDLDPVADGTPARLLVVVDELRALTEDVPDASAALTRIAAQGRSLGVHLVLATQRPAGAVGADLRANVSLRVALRVTDRADSTDVLDAPDAALVDASVPGRAWMRRGSAPLEPLQVARAVAAPAAEPVRPARPWTTSPGWHPPPGGREDPSGGAEAWVDAAGRAARDRASAARCPWLPALPAVVRRHDVPVGPGLALAVADLPDQQRRGPVRWDPIQGHLLVLGGPRSGRTTALVAVGLDALAHGRHVHTVGLPAAAVDLLRTGYAGLGSVLDHDDARATARLLELLAAPDHVPSVLLVDRLDVALERLGALARGTGADRLTSLWRASRGSTAVACGAEPVAAVLQHAGAFAQRLVLGSSDPTSDALAGVPSALAGPRPLPGRAVHLRAGTAELCQVVLPEAAEVARASGPRGAGPVVVRSLPDLAPLPDGLAARAHGNEVPLGPGGDDAELVWTDVSGGLLVAGPPGSGRTTALDLVARTLARAGRPVLRTAPHAAGAIPGVTDVAPDGLPAAARDLGGSAVVLVDDLDELERADAALGELLGAAPCAGLVASVTSASAVQAFRGAVPALLRRRRALVLDVHDAASAELVGPRAAWSVDPRRRPAGRGVLVRGRDAVVVQVLAPYSAGSSSTRP